MKQFFCLLLVLLSVAAGAQDKIYVRTQKQPIVGIITEVGTTDVKYHLVDRPLPVLTIEKQDIIRIQFESGQVLQLADPAKDFSLYYDQHLWNAKLNLFSPINGHTQLFLEQSVKPGKSREFELNLIGLGIDPNMLDAPTNPQTGKIYTYGARGLGLGYGLRFIRMPDFIGTNTRLRHLMQGSYIKPAISLSYYQRNFVTYDYRYSNSTYTVERKPVFSALGSVSFGRQWILDNTISIDAYVLAGIGYDNVRSTQEKVIQDVQGNPLYNYSDNTPYNAFGYTRFSKSDLGVALGAGLRIGFLFDWKQKTKTTIEK